MEFLVRETQARDGYDGGQMAGMLRVTPVWADAQPVMHQIQDCDLSLVALHSPGTLLFWCHSLPVCLENSLKTVFSSEQCTGKIIIIIIIKI